LDELLSPHNISYRPRSLMEDNPAFKQLIPYVIFRHTDPSGRHHHMVCQVCNGAYNLSPHYLEEFRNTLVQEFGFEPDLEHFAISGTCAECLASRSEVQGAE
ncbi:MAG: hypothetical protein ACE5Q6_13250, partial [Dehalococcoidia bacterium]